MAKGTAYANSLLLLVFNATLFANVAVNATSSPITSIFAALHTSDPGSAGDQTTNEMTTGAYASYARVAVTRASGAGGWTVTTNSVSPYAAITFPAGTGGSGATATHFSLGTLTSGAGVRLYSGTVTPNIVCGNGITPSLSTASTVSET
jgi:hypothetical protein